MYTLFHTSRRPSARGKGRRQRRCGRDAGRRRRRVNEELLAMLRGRGGAWGPLCFVSSFSQRARGAWWPRVAEPPTRQHMQCCRCLWSLSAFVGFSCILYV
jgi:hypothetical protein